MQLLFFFQLRAGKDSAVTRYLKSAQGTGGGSPKEQPEGCIFVLLFWYCLNFKYLQLWRK